MDGHDRYPDTDWTKAASPEAAGWSSPGLADAYDVASRIGTSAILIVQDGVVASEWGDIAGVSGLASIRKSLLSALIGTHVAEGTIDLTMTLDALGIDDCEPALSAEEKQATIADLLVSRSGVYHPAADQNPSVPPPRGSHAPGTHWFYNNWDFNALGVLLAQRSGVPIARDFAERIAQPLQMQDFDPRHFYFKTIPQSIHPAYKIRMSARDLARVGLLFLRGGRWRDRQVVPADWVRASTTPYANPGPGIGFGYSWWIGRYRLEPSGDDASCKDHPFYWASGLGNQYLMVFPLIGTVIVHKVADPKNGPSDAQLEMLQAKLLNSKMTQRLRSGPVTRYGAELRASREDRPFGNDPE